MQKLFFWLHVLTEGAKKCHIYEMGEKILTNFSGNGLLHLNAVKLPRSHVFGSTNFLEMFPQILQGNPKNLPVCTFGGHFCKSLLRPAKLPCSEHAATLFFVASTFRCRSLPNRWNPVQNSPEWPENPSTVVILYFDLRIQLIGKVLAHFWVLQLFAKTSYADFSVSM